MSDADGQTPILRRDDDARRFELLVDGSLVGVATFVVEPGDIVEIPHTSIDPARRGHGLGALMVRGVLDDLDARGLSVRPSCPFVADFIELHPEYRRLLAT